jgi:hypothetical protein
MLLQNRTLEQDIQVPLLGKDTSKSGSGLILFRGIFSNGICANQGNLPNPQEKKTVDPSDSSEAGRCIAVLVRGGRSCWGTGRAAIKQLRISG